MNIRDHQILQIALPSIVSNITVPLLGMIDVAIVGHMGSPVYIGAVAVGSMIFNLTYWLFGFLRMGSSGLTSQALGRRDLSEVCRILLRSIVIALGIALLLIVLQIPMKWAAFELIGPTDDVVPFASVYFNIVIWGAPASLALFSLMGWFIGMQNTRIPMFISIMQNVVNILASLTLVYGFGMKIEGVALGTVIAQYAGFIVALALLFRYYSRLRNYLVVKGTFVREAMGRFFHVNRDIFLRTLCLLRIDQLQDIVSGKRRRDNLRRRRLFGLRRTGDSLFLCRNAFRRFRRTGRRGGRFRLLCPRTVFHTDARKRQGFQRHTGKEHHRGKEQG